MESIADIYEESKRELLNKIDDICMECGYQCPVNCETCTVRNIVMDLENHSRTKDEEKIAKQLWKNRMRYAVDELGDDEEEWETWIEESFLKV